MKHTIQIIFLLLALTNCSATKVNPTNVSSSSENTPVDSVVKSDSSGSSDALTVADQECKKYNRRAIYVPDNTPDGQGSYQCVN